MAYSVVSHARDAYMPPTSSTPTLFLTTREVAQRLGVSPSTLSRWRKQGIGPDFVMFSSRTVRYSPASMGGAAAPCIDNLLRKQ